jgi:hypothetical protein
LQLSAFADASHLLANDLRGQSGILIKLGNNTIVVESKRQGMTTQSSTEAEILALTECANWLTWCRLFLNELGFKQDSIPIFQDNLSCIHIMQVGRRTSRTKHIQMRYFVVTELLKQKILHLLYRSTLDMAADALTKPLEPTLFTKFRKVILNEKTDEEELKFVSAQKGVLQNHVSTIHLDPSSRIDSHSSTSYQ